MKVNQNQAWSDHKAKDCQYHAQKHIVATSMETGECIYMEEGPYTGNYPFFEGDGAIRRAATAAEMMEFAGMAPWQEEWRPHARPAVPLIRAAGEEAEGEAPLSSN